MKISTCGLPVVEAMTFAHIEMPTAMNTRPKALLAITLMQ
jgi:hypothetical protein